MCVCVCVRERESYQQTDRQMDRHTQRARDRQKKQIAAIFRGLRQNEKQSSINKLEKNKNKKIKIKIK